MLRDAYGNEVSMVDAVGIEAINAFTVQLLQIGKQAGAIIEVADKNPACFLLQVYAAVILMYGQTQQAAQKAKLYLDKAEKFFAFANPREQSFYSAVRAWQEYHLSQALLHLEKHCLKWPRDLAALKVTEYIYYYKGQQFEAKRFLHTTSASWEINHEDPFYLSIHSFALELNGLIDDAQKTADKALLLNPHNPWAHHTLTHVYLNTGKIQEGINALEGYSTSWKTFHHGIESHNLWHLALLYLENLDFEAVQKVYQRAHWEEAKLITEEIDAAALLWRLDMEDQNTDQLWQTLAPFIDGHASFGVSSFTSAHLCYALKRAKQDVFLNEALKDLKHFVEKQTDEDRQVWETVGLPIIYGSVAFAEKKYQGTLVYYEPVINKVGCVGGSDAQVDLFRQTYLKALIGAKRFADARAFWQTMVQNKKPSLLEQKWLAESHTVE